MTEVTLAYDGIDKQNDPYRVQYDFEIVDNGNSVKLLRRTTYPSAEGLPIVIPISEIHNHGLQFLVDGQAVNC